MKRERCTCKECGAEHNKPAPSQTTPLEAGYLFAFSGAMIGSAINLTAGILVGAACFVLGHWSQWRAWKKAAL